jgi:hypothetical protein
MISVQNHPLPLSGNRIWSILISLFVILSASCDVARPLPKDDNKVSKDGTFPKKEQISQKDTTNKKVGKTVQPVDSLKLIFPPTFKNRYTISVFLPFYFDSIEREQNLKTPVSVSREFYKGLLLAADTLQKCGLRLDIHTFDSENDWSFYSLQDTLVRNKTDLIIGPILDSRIKWMDSISNKQKINYVSSLQSNENGHTRGYYFQSVPSPKTEGITASRVAKSNKGYRVFVILEKASKAGPMADAFIASFPKDSLTILDCNGRGSKALPEKIPFADSNVFLIPSKNEGFVSAVMSKLRVDSSKIVVIAPMQWQFFKTFEGDMWEKFQLHLLSPYFIDYDNPALSGFIAKYRSKYKEEPSIWSFFGFDEMAYYGKMLQGYGKYFQAGVGKLNTPMLHTIYRLRNKNGHGWQNEYVNILKFENYKLKRVEH